jgi:mRNA-degrading endonuclease RelE of RelBE toxin-antitoxin system
MTILESEEFQKEFKKLQKKYRTLEADFSVAKMVITAAPTGDDSKHWITLWQQGNKRIMKVRMLCRALSRSTFRLIYVYDGDIVELLFIEIYFKGTKEREDQERIRDIIRQIQQ